MSMDAREAVKIALSAMEEKKAEDIRILGIGEVSSIADFFLISHGRNVNQVHAIADEVEEKLARAGMEPRQIEGYQNAEWVLMDYGDFIVHIFDEENRAFFHLERIWQDGTTPDLAEFR